MSRKKRSPEEQARRAKIRELLQESNISSMAGFGEGTPQQDLPQGKNER